MQETERTERPCQIPTDKQRELIEYNRSVIYRIPDKYSYLQEMIKPVYQDLLDIFKYVSKHGLFRFHGRYTFVLGNDALTYKVRRKTTLAVTNRHINYLVVLGLIRKERDLAKANIAFKEQHSDLLPIGQYSIPYYTPERMAKIEERAEQMHTAGITTGNISRDQLYFNGFQELALFIYSYNDRKKLSVRATERELLFGAIDDLIARKGYATKQDIRLDERFGGAGSEIDKVFRIFRQDFQKIYDYKRPTQADKLKFNISGNQWIITSKN